ncbi:MAG: signal recognition particle-docking protein FtsY [Methanosarcinales archaeon]|nr:MAG: signal recognition particle-docking protein FtsY [Methanosarcinales archaeon]
MFDVLRRKVGAFKSDTKTLILERKLDEKSLEKTLQAFELALIESNIAVPVAEGIISSVKAELLGTKIGRRANIDEILESALQKAMIKVLSANEFDFDEYVKKAEKPVNIIFVGVNGTGKTTTVAKIAQRLKKQGYSVVIASADTYRAGATEQIETHAERLNLKVIKHQLGGDPAAVVYDGVQYARARHKDIVLADTAGRMHTNVNLMEELKKIGRVTSPDLVIFVDEATAGNDAVERAKKFNDAVGIDGSILTKVDVDVKGGAAISIAHTTGKPILFLGTGQEYDDLVKFQPEWLVDKLLEG